MVKKNKLDLPSSLAPWAIPFLVLCLWQFLSWKGIIPERILPAPTDVLQAGISLLKSGEMASHISISLGRALAGFLIGGILGFFLGLFNGIFRTSELLFDTSIQMIRNIPHLALIPLVILWFGIDETSKVFLVALGVLFPVYINTYHGIKSGSDRNGQGIWIEGTFTIFFHHTSRGAVVDSCRNSILPWRHVAYTDSGRNDISPFRNRLYGYECKGIHANGRYSSQHSPICFIR
jgi:membrane protein YqaA with SNARE-associated domain